MAVKENALGAPTEGLGQNVTFAFSQGQAPVLQVGGTSAVNAGVQGGGTLGAGSTQGVGIKAPPNPTIDLLMKAGNKYFEHQIEQRRTEQFVIGMQRAMAGEAVKDIADAQPWYSTLFGEADVVEGARAYTGHVTAQTAVAAMEDQMPEIRKMGQAEAQAYFVDNVNSKLTGDKPTDLAILQGMTKALPMVMRRQAKEHYGYLQENATAAETAAFKAGAVNLQAAAKGLATGVTTPEEFAASRDQFVRSVAPAYGRDEENYKKSMTANLVNWGSTGQLHALNALKETGFLDVLDPEQQAAVERATEAGESKLRTKYSFDWSDDLAHVEANSRVPPTGTTARDIGVQVDALNKRFNDATGSRLGLIPPGQKAALISGSAVEIAKEKDRQAEAALRAAEKAQADGDKAAAEFHVGSTIKQRFASGGLGTLASSPGFSNPEIDKHIMPEYNAMSPADQVKALSLNMRENFVSPTIKAIRVGQINAAIATAAESGMTDSVARAFDSYVQLREVDPQAADAYYSGPDNMKARLEGMYNDVRNGLTPEGSFRQRFLGPASRSSLSDKELKNAINVVNNEYNSWAPAWMGGAKLQPGTARWIASEIGEDVKTLAAATNGDVKEATGRALKAAQGRGLEVLGGFGWRNANGQVSLSKYLTSANGPKGSVPVATDKLNEEFGMAVEQLLYGKDDKAGILPDTASDTSIFRMADVKGVPQFHVQSVVDGNVYEGTLSANDVFTLAAKRKEVKKSSTFGINNESLKFGPKITYGVNAPKSIY